MKKKIAIIGSGISGLSAAYFLCKKYEVSIFEKNNYLGGHVNTLTVDDRKAILMNRVLSNSTHANSADPIEIDTGFMVFNHINYPNLIKLFSKLKLETSESVMSLGVFNVGTGFEYMGNNFFTIFSQKINLIRPAFLKMLWEVRRFHQEAVHIIQNQHKYSMTVKEFVADSRYSYYFIWYYLLPFISAVWSTPPLQMMQFPIYHLVKFLQNHGLLDYPRMYDWKTVRGGSKMYVEQLLKKIQVKMFTDSPVQRVEAVVNSLKQIRVYFKDATSKIFDKVIVATHADKALEMMKGTKNSKSDHQRLLSTFYYQKNKTYLHTDSSQMPKLKKNWASWNVGVDLSDKSQPQFFTSYYMNELQHLATKRNYFVTLNPIYPIAEEHIIKTMIYYHPVFSTTSLNAQSELQLLNNQNNVFQNLYFCGSYFGYGFHEDGISSSLVLAKQILGKDFEWH